MSAARYAAVVAFTALADQPLDERIQAVNTAVQKKWPENANVQPSPYAYAVQVFDDSVVVRWKDKLYAMPYDVDKDGTVSLGEPTEVKQTYVAAAMKYSECEMCGGTGQVKDGDHQKDCPTCEGEGKMRAAAGARHSASDTSLIQSSHDAMVALGARCELMTPAEKSGIVK